MNNETLGVLVVSAACITGLALIGFNRPSWLRTYTTAARYHYAMVVHIALYLGLLLSVYALAVATWRTLGSDYDGSDAALLALTVALLVRLLPWSARRMRDWAHGLAGIPSTGRRFASALSEVPLLPSETIRLETYKTLLSRGIDLHQDWLPPVRPVHEQVAKTTGLFLQLRDWDRQPAFRTYMAEARNEFDMLRQRFDRLLLRVARSLANIETLGHVRFLADRGNDEELDDLVRRIVGNTVSDLCEDLKHFHRDACLFTARGVMTSRWTRSGRTEALTAMGFVDPKCEPRPGYALVLLQCSLLMYGGCWIFFLLSPTASTGKLSPAEQFLIVTLLLWGSLAIAIVPKRHWGFANSGIHRRTPVGFVIGAGFAALLFAIVLNLLGGAAFAGGMKGAVAWSKESSLFLHWLVLNAMAMAWLVQDHRWAGATGNKQRRLYDAGVLVGTWCASTVVWATLMSSPAIAQYAGLPQQALLGPESARGLLFALLLGSAIGALLPSAVRVAAPRPAAANTPHDVELLQAEADRCAIALAEKTDGASGFASLLPAPPEMASPRQPVQVQFSTARTAI